MKLLFTILFYAFLFFPAAFSQKVNAFFSKNEVRIGEPVKITVFYNHPSDQTVIFPDSGSNYYPFEFISKKYFPTKTEGRISRDCTIYTLRTFNVNNVPQIKFPVFILSESDTVVVHSAPVRIKLKEMLNSIPENAELKESISYAKVQQGFNFPLYIIIGLCGFAFLLIIKYLFGKPLIRRYKIISIILAHGRFVKSFEHLEYQYLSKKEVYILERLLSEWKNYLAKLEEKPLSTYTSTEIIKFYGKEELKNSLKTLDRTIFGGIISNQEDKAIKSLKSFSNKRYINRKNEIRKI